MINKRRDAKIEYQKSVAVPRKRTRRTSPAENDQMDTNLETLVNDSVPMDMSKGDADGKLDCGPVKGRLTLACSFSAYQGRRRMTDCRVGVP